MKLRRFLNQVLAFIPSRLPTGMEEFEKWSASIMDNHVMPTEDRASIQYVLASTILTFGPTVSYKSKRYFVGVITNAAAKQVASGVFQQIKRKQQEEALAEKAANGTQGI